MPRYLNRRGDSNVVAYETAPGKIAVKFGDGSIYLYTDESASPEHIRTMHELAARGAGLNGYINRYVRKGYSQKIHALPSWS